MTHRVPDPGAITNPEGLRDEGKDDAGDQNGNGEVVEIPVEVDLAITDKVAPADEHGPRDCSGGQTVVPGRADDENGPEGPEDDDRVEDPVLVIPGFQAFRGRLAFLFLVHD